MYLWSDLLFNMLVFRKVFVRAWRLEKILCAWAHSAEEAGSVEWRRAAIKMGSVLTPHQLSSTLVVIIWNVTEMEKYFEPEINRPLYPKLGADFQLKNFKKKVEGPTMLTANFRFRRFMDIFCQIFLILHPLHVYCPGFSLLSRYFFQTHFITF